MGFEVEALYPPPYDALVPPWFDLTTPTPIECEGGPQVRTLYVTLHEDAPPGAVPIRVIATTTEGASCETTGMVTVERTYSEVEILYKTFIECEVAGPTPWDPTLFDFFRGDHRGFGYGPGFGASDSRTFQRIFVTLDPDNPTRTVGIPMQVMGATQGYNDDPDGSQVTLLPTPYCFGQCAYTFVPGVLPDCTGTTDAPVSLGYLSVQVTPISLSQFQVFVRNRAQDQCEQFVPGIDVDLFLDFRQICANGVLGPLEFRARGSYDGYPWHELYLNGTAVFTHDPCLTNEGPNSMFPPAEHVFEADDKGNATPLSEWQVVPGS